MFNINELIYEYKTAIQEDDTGPSYQEVLSLVKSQINEQYRNELKGDLTRDIVKDRYKVLIQQMIHEKKLYVNGYTQAQLIELIYNSMAKYDFLTPYIEGNSGELPDDPIYQTWEEINCNRYDDVEVVVAGEYRKLDKAFDSPDACVDIVRRMARLGGLTLDKANPRGDSFLGNGIRITATVPPCVDSDTGAAFSIRRQKNITNSKEFFLENETACEEELDLVTLLVNNGVPICYVGGTGSGKTADINYVLSNIDSSNRIYTIEDVRELNLVLKDQEGRYLSRVVHTVTKQSDDEKQEVTADDLLRDALRYHPKIIGLGEMRGKEAKTTITSGGTDHTIITGLHASGPKSAYRRIATLYMDAGTNLSEKMVYENIVEAIPVIIHKKAFKSGERRYMSICEAILSDDIINPEIRFNVIFQYVVTDFVRDSDGRLKKVIGEHKKVGSISKSLAQRLFENGVELATIRKFAGEGFTPGEENEL